MAAGNFQYEHFNVAWNAVVRPWLEAASSFPGRQVCWIRSSAWVAWIKRRMAIESVSCIGVEFLTTGGLRRLLRDDDDPLILREELQLIVSLAAVDLPEGLLAETARRDPAAFAKVIDLLDAVGVAPDVIVDADLRALLNRVFALADRIGLALPNAADRQIANVVTEPGSRVLALGLGARDVCDISLLRAATVAFAEVINCCPIVGNSPLAELFSATVEAFLGEPILLIGEEDDDEASQSHALATAFETRSASDAGEVVSALAETPMDEANRLVSLAIEAVAPEGNPVAIILESEVSPLAMLVTDQLVDLGIPHFDGVGRAPGMSVGHALFEAWINWQESRQLTPFLRFLDWLERAGHGSFKRLKRFLDERFKDTMTGDLRVLLANAQEEPGLFGKFFDEDVWPIFPDEVVLGEFVQRLVRLAEIFRWPDDRSAFERRLRRFACEAFSQVPLRPLLHWAAETIREPGRSRDPLGRELFAGIYVLSARQACGLDWGAVLLGGVQGQSWPGKPPAMLLDDASVQTLNRSGLEYGASGETVLSPNRGWGLTEAEHRSVFELEMASLLRGCGGRVAVSSSRLDPNSPDKASAPAALFHRLMALRKQPVTPPGQWGQAPVDSGAECPDSPAPWRIDEQLNAWHTRRNPELPFERYSLCLEGPELRQLVLPASAWERLITRPAAGWFSCILGLPEIVPPANQSPERTTFGTWLHQWLRPGLQDGQSTRCPNAAEWNEMVRQRSDSLKASVEKLFNASGRILPDWWHDTWSRCRTDSLSVVKSLTQARNMSEWKSAVGEWRLPESIQILLPELGNIPLSGRIDLLLATDEQLSSTQGHAWIIDYKTGSAKPLSLSSLNKGTGLQAVLYGLALASLGFKPAVVGLTFLKPDDDAIPQVTLEACIENLEWAKLFGPLVQNGCIGMSEDDIGERAHGLPLAFLPPEDHQIKIRRKLSGLA